MIAGQSLEPMADLLDRWEARGWLRPIDVALAQFLARNSRTDQPLAILAAALVSHQLGRGHICLMLDALADDMPAQLGLPPQADDAEAASALQTFARVPLDDWLRALRQSGFAEPGAGSSPLVLEGKRLYLRRYWHYEQTVAAAIRQRIAASRSPDDAVGRTVARMFGGLDASSGTNPDWQVVAAALTARSRFSVVSGGPGTGKTTTVVRLLAVLQELAGQPLRIGLAAPTGKAAARLTESIGQAVDQLPSEVRGQLPGQVTTLHRLLGSLPRSRKFRHHAGNPLHLDVLVIDEASMVDLEMMARVVDALAPEARLVLVGDKDQLAAVEAGAVLGEICAQADQPGYTDNTAAWVKQQTAQDISAWCGVGSRLADHIAVLRKSYRFGERSGIARLARAVNTADAEAFLACLDQPASDIGRLALPSLEDGRLDRLILDGDAGQFQVGHKGSAARPGAVGYGHYLTLMRDRVPDGDDPGAVDDWARAVLQAFGRFQLLCAVRRGPWGVETLNAHCRKVLVAADLLAGSGQWYAGRPVLVTRNDYALGLMNGDIGVTLPDPAAEHRLRVFFQQPDGSLKQVLPVRLDQVETAFALTVHKSQGSEFEHTALILPDRISSILTRELLYTGITRSSAAFTLVASADEVVRAAVARRVSRASGLAERLHGGLDE